MQKVQELVMTKKQVQYTVMGLGLPLQLQQEVQHCFLLVAPIKEITHLYQGGVFSDPVFMMINNPYALQQLNRVIFMTMQVTHRNNPLLFGCMNNLGIGPWLIRIVYRKINPKKPQQAGKNQA